MISSDVLREKIIDFLTKFSPFSREQISSLPDDTLYGCFIDILDHMQVDNGGIN